MNSSIPGGVQRRSKYVPVPISREMQTFVKIGSTLKHIVYMLRLLRARHPIRTSRMRVCYLVLRSTPYFVLFLFVVWYR